MRRKRHYANDAAISFPIRAQVIPAREEVADFRYIECEEPPDTSHGVIWAHSLGASPPDIFGELMAWMDHKAKEAVEKAAYARLWRERIGQ